MQPGVKPKHGNEMEPSSGAGKFDGPKRPAPEVIFVPPPDGPGMPTKRVVNIAGACVIGGAARFVVIIAKGGTVSQLMMIMAPIYLVVAIIVAVRYRQVGRMHQIAGS